MEQTITIIGNNPLAWRLYGISAVNEAVTLISDHELTQQDIRNIAKASDIVFIAIETFHKSDGTRDMSDLYDLIDEIITETEKCKGKPKIFVNASISLPGTNGILTRLYDNHTFATLYRINEKFILGANGPKTKDLLSSLIGPDVVSTALKVELLYYVKEYFLLGVANLHKEINDWCKSYKDNYITVQKLLEETLSQTDIDNFDKMTKDRNHRELAQEILKEAELRGVESPILKTITE